MSDPHSPAFSFPRYLASKKTVDDRALNPNVWQALQAALDDCHAARPLQVLEIGAGIGTMLERLLDGSLLRQADYTLLDADAENLHTARRRLPEWAAAHAWQASLLADGSLRLDHGNRRIRLDFEAADVFDFITRRPGARFDLLVAHAVLDLFDLSRALPPILGLLHPGGWFYFTLNFDGLTILEPPLDPGFDEQAITAYHASMDERRVNGRPSGDSRSGRRLFHLLPANGAEILQAGASDWLVYPRQGAYPVDEAYFLECILHFFEQSLAGRAEIDARRLAAWLAGRRAQVARGELVYIAHQIDFFGKVRD
jgi:SAM-dependent methyltransferase